ncbi:hypothetical protein [Emcibacter sp. SYSU 3D8]|uniref:hypothetical protein n=1 Tax=Emcibacter sp. SYSU 3D8 TaxID=3133969 RepID=UPI0031FE9A81
MPKLFWIGIAILVLGTGPLLGFAAADELGLISDPHPNPIGLGILAGITIWPGIAMTAIGILQAVRRGSAG